MIIWTSDDLTELQETDFSSIWIQNRIIFNQENEFENAVCKLTPFCSGFKC